jgi:anti-sigma B factor antagonist
MLSARGMADETRPSEQPVAHVERRDGTVIVQLVGELDLYNAPTVREALLALCAEHPERLVVDLQRVAFIDSTGLGVLIEARSTLPDRESFLLAAPTPQTYRALQISGLDRHLSVHDSVAAAVRSRGG